MKLCGFEAGPDQPFFLIAGPCVIESEALVLDIAGRMRDLTRELGIPCVVSAVGATRRIPDGALIEVDGNTGRVTVIELP